VLRDLLPARSDLADMGRRPLRNLLSGVTVAVVALPLALGFGASSGLGPEAGLATAIVAGALAALFGGSSVQVSGPTGAMTVVLVPIVARYGPGGVLMVGLMAGVLLVLLALFRAGRYMRFVPTPVIEGFTVGIAAVIALQQVPSALGVEAPEGENTLLVAAEAARGFAAEPDWQAPALALGTAAVVLLGGRLLPRVPVSILAVAGAGALVAFTPLTAAPVGDIPAGLPAPSLDFLDPAAVGPLLTSAVAVAALAALESLLSASVADGMTGGPRHHPDRELFGQGLANIVTPLFGGVPATAAIARTAVNVRSGASSRLAALTHALVLAAVVYAAAPLVGAIPMAALAGVLLATAVRMVDAAAVRSIMRTTRGDAAVLVCTTLVTLAFDLVLAVLVGLVLSGALALRAVAGNARLDRLHVDGPEEGPAVRVVHPPGAAVFRLDGPLFFAGAHRLLVRLHEVRDVPSAVLDMSRVTAVDATGALLLKEAVDELELRGVAVHLSGVRPGHHRPLRTVGLLDDTHAVAPSGEAFDARLLAPSPPG